MRLGFGFSIILALMVVIMVVVIISMGNIQATLTKIVNVNVYKLNLCTTMADSINKITNNTREMVLVTDPAAKGELQKKIADLRSKYDEASDALDKTPATEAGMAIRKQIKDALGVARPLTNKVVELTLAGNDSEAVKVMVNETGPAIQKWLDLLDEAVTLQNDSNTQEAANAEGSYRTTLIVIIALGAAAIILGITIALLVTRGITKPVKKIAEDLTEGAQQVASASNQLSATSQQLAEGNAEQASSIEETSSTLEESSSMVQQNSENTKQAALLAAQTKASSDKGNLDMQEMMSSMSEIKKSSDQIAKIIKVIDEIAFQTNILALNAAVEAARAGDAGMGFAVVAEEVRNLAQRSAQAAKDTAAIIESNIELSEKGVSVAKKVGESLAEITIQAKKVNELMDDIAAASQEQSQGISQINKAISQMEQVTQQNAANAEESASASEELSAQAQNLREIVQQLEILVDGKSAVDSHQGGFPGKTASIHKAVKKLETTRSLSKPGDRPAALHTAGMAGEPGREGKKTFVVNPDDIIPLHNDAADF